MGNFTENDDTINRFMYERLKHYVNRRDYLSKRNPHPCENCGDTMQQQLLDYMCTQVAEWKCRICKHVYLYEPPIISQADQDY